jgi:hypothetical protein|tara:strand:- start:625 stop:792 length:168 start_codon:yes stop_codon:yes gene_type:complete
MDFLITWLSVLTILFFIESSAIIYFVRWILWRWNGSIQDLLIAHYSNSESDNEEE